VERDPLVRGLLLMLAAIGAVWLAGWVWQVFSRFADIILLFFLAWLLAFVLNPLAKWLQSLGLPRLAAVALVYVGLALGLIGILLHVVPALITQTVQLIASLPALARNLQARGDEFHSSLLARGLPEAQLTEIYRNAISRAETVGSVALSNSLTVATAVLNSLLRAALVLIISFYIMLDGDKIGRLFVSLMPVRYRLSTGAVLEQIDRTFGGFVRGQVIQAAVFGLGTWAVMQMAALPYSLVLSIFAGLAMVLPFIGPYLAVGPPVILAIILAPSKVWWVFLLLFVLQFVGVNVLAPRIMSHSVGIHPLLVFAAILIGAQVAGGWGAIFGIPAAAMLYLLARLFYQRVVLHTPLYRSSAPISIDSNAPFQVGSTEDTALEVKGIGDQAGQVEPIVSANGSRISPVGQPNQTQTASPEEEDPAIPVSPAMRSDPAASHTVVTEAQGTP
jgi:predicted PurR-regulated permease PerM